MTYIVRRRAFSPAFPPYERPWELLRDGLPVGFYVTSADAVAASPEEPHVIQGEGPVV